MNGLVSVVIVNFNSMRFLERCLHCLREQTYQNIEVIIVDNCSSDGSTQIYQKSQEGFKRYVYLRSEVNLGSSKANNIGIREGKGDFFLILNADVFLTPEFIEKGLQGLRDERVGTVIGKLLSERDHTIIDSVGVSFFREGVAIDIGIGQKDVGQFNASTDVGGACCAAALYRKAMLESIKSNDEFYDENYFAFVEDADLSLTAYLSGWVTRYIPDAIGYHVRGGSSAQLSNFVRYLAFRNEKYFFNKYFRKNFLFARLTRCILDNIRMRHFPHEEAKKLKSETQHLIQIADIKSNTVKNSSNKQMLQGIAKEYYIFWNLKRKLRELFS